MQDNQIKAYASALFISFLLWAGLIELILLEFAVEHGQSFTVHFVLSLLMFCAIGPLALCGVLECKKV